MTRHVSAVTPIKGHLDGERPLRLVLGCICPPGVTHSLDCDVHGVNTESEAEFVGKMMPAPVRTRGASRQRARKVLVHRADPGVWTAAMALAAGDFTRLTLEPDGSVIVHNQPWQATAWKRRKR